MPESSVEERRKTRRFEKRSSVKAARIEYPMGKTPSVSGEMVDLSSGGVKFECGDRFELHSLVQVSLTLPGWTRHHPGYIRVYEDSIGRPFTAIGQVLRCERHGNKYDVAARFVNIDPDDLVGFEGYLSAQDLKK